jgi:hypothetical protein
MNDFFSPTRFWWLLKKMLFEHRRALLIILGIAYLATPLLYPKIKLDTERLTSDQGVYPQGGILSLILILAGWNIALILSDKFTNRKGYAFLSLPATHFEKILSIACIVFVLFPMFYLPFFRLIDIIGVNAYHNSLDPKDHLYATNYAKLKIFSFCSGHFFDYFSVFLTTSGLIVLGNWIFRRYAIISVIGIVALSIFLLDMLNNTISNFMFKNKTIEWSSFYYEQSIRITESNHTKFVKLDNLPFTIIYSILIPALIWITAYVRLREKEV